MRGVIRDLMAAARWIMMRPRMWRAKRRWAAHNAQPGAYQLGSVKAQGLAAYIRSQR